MFKPIETWIIDTPEYGRTAQICVDDNGIWWLFWIGWNANGEIIYYSQKRPNTPWQQPVPVGTHKPKITGLSIDAWNDGILLAWIDDNDPREDGLKLATIDSLGNMSQERLIAHCNEVPLFPKVATAENRFALVWTTRHDNGRRLLGFIGEDPSTPSLKKTISAQTGLHTNPSICFSNDVPWVAWQEMDKHNNNIWVRRLDLAHDPIWIDGDHQGIAALPDICADPKGGTWIAWQSDLNADGQGSLVRWIEVAHLDNNGIVRNPSQPLPSIERNGTGEDQGFESPSLAVGPEEELIVIGRGSQSVRRTDLNSNGWTENLQIDRPGWQCRSRYYTTAVCAEGLLVSGREKQGITVRLLPFTPDKGPARPAFPSASEPARLGDKIGTRPSKVSNNHANPCQSLMIENQRVIFGDIHQHTIASDGTGSAAETYYRAKNRYGDELVAVADHESFLGKKTPPGEWFMQKAIADEHNQEGSFITLPAYEWTSNMHPGPGHKVIYPPFKSNSTVLSRDAAKTQTSEGLIDACRRLGALAFPHHVGWTGADMANHASDIQTCFEIVSCHGAYERPGVGPIGTRGDDKEGQFICDALDNGLRFGFVGGSDGHGLNWHHGICRIKDSHRSGLTAILTNEITREAAFQALSNRKCYATSGAKILLWFEIDGHSMGEEIPVTESVSFSVSVKATATIDAVHLVTNDGKEIQLEHDGLQAHAQGTLSVPKERRWAYYFVRVIQSDGHMAWSSPIWLDAPGSQGSGLPAA